jgi:hypothetical protein
MEAFDSLSPEVRSLVCESANDVALAGRLRHIHSKGCPPEILGRIQARGLLPYQLGDAGILAELVMLELVSGAKAP